MKETIEKLASDYEGSKEVDVLRRYKLLKSMIKRSVTQVRLRSDANGQTMSTGTQRQQMKKKEEQVNCECCIREIYNSSSIKETPLYFLR